MASLSQRALKVRELERQREQLERINAEQQTYVSSQEERCRQSAVRLEEKETEVRHLQEELVRMREQYKMVLESSKVSIISGMVVQT